MIVSDCAATELPLMHPPRELHGDERGVEFRARDPTWYISHNVVYTTMGCRNTRKIER